MQQSEHIYSTNFTIIANVPPNAPILTLANSHISDYYDGETVVVNASNITDSDGNITKIDYFVNNSIVATKTPTGSIDTTTVMSGTLTLGNYQIMAVNTDDNGDTNTSQPLNITVKKQGDITPPTVTLTGPTLVAVGQTATYTIHTSTAGGNGTITNVSFEANAITVYSKTENAETVTETATWTPITAGTYTLSAKGTTIEGSTGYSSSIIVTAFTNHNPIVTISGITNGTYVIGTTFNLSASATETDFNDSIQSVTIQYGSTILTSGINSANTIWTPTQGIYLLTITAIDSFNGSTTNFYNITILDNQPSAKTSARPIMPLQQPPQLMAIGITLQ